MLSLGSTPECTVHCACFCSLDELKRSLRRQRRGYAGGSGCARARRCFHGGHPPTRARPRAPSSSTPRGRPGTWLSAHGKTDNFAGKSEKDADGRFKMMLPLSHHKLYKQVPDFGRRPALLQDTNKKNLKVLRKSCSSSQLWQRVDVLFDAGTARRCV